MNPTQRVKQKKYRIKIPNNISIFYCNKKNIILFKGLSKQKLLKISNLLCINFHKQEIEITYTNIKKLSNINKKKIQIILTTTVSFIKQYLIESTAIIFQKLKFIGVGYRIFPVENFEDRLLTLKLGYSHSLYFRVPSEIKIVPLKFTKLFLSGYSYQQITLTASKIRLNKIPEPYKGKGILYENEKIRLKEGKKV